MNVTKVWKEQDHVQRIVSIISLVARGGMLLFSPFAILGLWENAACGAVACNVL